VVRASKVRRVAVTAAYGGGSVGLATAAAYGVLVGQAALARRWIPRHSVTPPPCDGVYGGDRPGVPLVLGVLGDSSAAGLGADLPRETPAALLAVGLSELVGRPVRVVCVARVGAQSADLHDQAARVLAEQPDIVVIMVGGNDVTHQVRPAVAVQHLGQVVRRLREEGSEVVVGTCPDLGTIEPVKPPLRWLARRWSRNLAAVQTVTVVEAGGRTVSLGDLLGPEFARDPGLFAADRFHPSASGYAAAAAALLPSLVAALAPDEPAPATSAARGEVVLPLVEAAVEAADTAGAEVTATEVGGRERGRGGRWAALRHRIRLAPRTPADPAPEHGPEPAGVEGPDEPGAGPRSETGPGAGPRSGTEPEAASRVPAPRGPVAAGQRRLQP